MVPFNAPEILFYSQREAAEISNPFSAESAERRAASSLVNLRALCSTEREIEVQTIGDRFFGLAATPYPLLNSAETHHVMRVGEHAVVDGRPTPAPHGKY
ncbi:MAG TPA: hypothetical protein VFW03_16445 [Gemmatimonadaceae bacterium]|nr:hypothetical protein [Gemmatimonadaceae bacterium]